MSWFSATMQLLTRIPTAAAHPAAVAARGVALRVPSSAVFAGRARVESFGRWSAPLGQRGFAADTAQPINGAKSAPHAYPEQQMTIEEVDFHPTRANSVSLIGNLGTDPEVKHLSTGKIVANMPLAVRRGGKTVEGKDWYDVEMWDHLATLAGEQLRRGAQVLVEGRLRQAEWNDKVTGQKRVKTRVVAQSIHMVRKSGVYHQQLQGQEQQQQEQPYGYQQPSAGEWSAPGAQEPLPGGEWNAPDQGGVGFDLPFGSTTPQPQWGAPQGGAPDKDQVWQDLINDRSAYWDMRGRKTNPKAPDFKHKSTGDALWLNSAPAWARDQLEMPADAPPNY
mmetsp:Transcript_19973/g.60359  ORF Transcript_19973/g.60359 Transcript_19973/m.60359 type:complete len:335 (-) Transcript_19973:2305-3309(-)